MTKKHFIAAAKQVSFIQNLAHRHIVAMEFADFFRAHCPAFNWTRFLTACNIDTTK